MDYIEDCRFEMWDVGRHRAQRRLQIYDCKFKNQRLQVAGVREESN